MSRQYLVVATVGVLVTGTASAQGPAKIDFVRDVQPLFQAHCVECHGPKQQKNGFRLDRRRDAMRGGGASRDRTGDQRGEPALPPARRRPVRPADAAGRDHVPG